MAADEPKDSVEPGEEPRTIFVPQTGAAPAPAVPPPFDDPSPSSPPPPASSAPPAAGNATFMPRTPRENGASIQVGDVLNHIFEVKRFIARGGMGEVFEGANVSSDERVAIKVMLPALAADPNVRAMFRREARTLTRLAHPALVQYRVLAQEPQLGVLYIVTEYIDGTNLSDMLGQIDATPDQLRALARRLADGLRVAHGLGAIHRDISPDNVLLENGRLDGAKIIDFGIAKDLDPSTKTIVGDGFAGKLNYVAPEQLGDFGRDVGAWSDVYSLGLVLLAVAIGRDVDMGATLVDAVDRRRSGPDLSKVPDSLRPVLEQMLVPDPAHRLRSMEAVIAALDGAPVAAPAAAKPPSEPKPQGAGAPRGGSSKRGLLIGGAAAAAIAAIGAGYWLTSGTRSSPPAAVAPAVVNAPAHGASADGRPAVDRARSAIERALPGVSCSWLDIGALKPDGGGVALSVRGAARDPADAQGAIARALSGANVQVTNIDFEGVATATPEMCVPLDALRPLRDPAGDALAVERPKFELAKDETGELNADAVVTIKTVSAGPQYAILGIEPTGIMDAMATSKEGLATFIKEYPDRFTREGDHYRVLLNTTHTGLTGLIFLSSTQPLSPADAALLTAPPAAHSSAWASQVAAAAQRGGWKTQMVWYRTVDDIPG